MSTIFNPIAINQLTIPNRIVMAPMCMYRAAADGQITDWHYTHYTTRAVGQVGLILTEATAVQPEGRISDNDLGLWSDEQIPGLQRMVQAVQALGSKIGIQLAHAGRKSGSASVPHYSISGKPFSDAYIPPTKIDAKDMVQIVQAFELATKRALKAGFDLIEIHAAHGYLLSEVISPLPRPGLQLEQRIPLLEQVVRAVRKAWPADKPLQVRISATDYRSDGLSRDELLQLSDYLADWGVDAINVSSGGVIETVIDSFPGYQIPLAEQLKRHSDLVIIGGGLISSIDMLTEILDNQRADMVYLGRELLRNPYFLHQVARKYQLEAWVPQAYRRA